MTGSTHAGLSSPKKQADGRSVHRCSSQYDENVRCVFIFNPTSGRNRHLRTGQLRQVEIVFSQAGHRTELIATTRAGSAATQARDAVEAGAEVIFACGGDGTIHDVMQGLVSETGRHRTALGIIPMGTANALARHLGLSMDPVTAALQQVQCTARSVPIGKVEAGQLTRYFVVMAGAGPDGALVYNLLQSDKAQSGRLAYYVRSARLFLTQRFRAFELEYAPTASGPRSVRIAVSVMAVRVADLGGLFSGLTGKDAGIHDPHLHLISLAPPGWLSLPLWFLSGWLNLRRFNPLLHAVAVTEFSCRPLANPAQHFQADGEWLGRIPMRVSIVEDALRIVMRS